MYSQVVGTQKLCNCPLLPGTSASSIASAISRASANTHYEPPGETFTPKIFNSNKSRLGINSLQNKADFFQLKLKDYFRFESQFLYLMSKETMIVELSPAPSLNHMGISRQFTA